MAPSRILDTHIHLWPSTSLQPINHGWMTPGHQLAKQHGISDYNTVTNSVPDGFVYVETDRFLPSTRPDITGNESDDEKKNKLQDWAKEPLEELNFLRRIVEGEEQEGDGFEQGDGELMKGCVVWAPFHLSPALFRSYLKLAEDKSGPALWSRVVGFRYLLQGKGDAEVQKLTSNDDWHENIASLGKGRDGKGWAFDVGVDTHRDGDGPLERVAQMIESVRQKEMRSDEDRKRVRFVLNHLCKPNLSKSTPSPRWRSALSRLSSDENVFMKLSGAFNEFDATPSTGTDIVKAITPFVNIVFKNFPQRVMFGSDWPVCNVGGPKSETGNWKLWVEIVENVMNEQGHSEKEKDSVWWQAGAEAYGIDM